jgi:hypothetical protein
MLPESNGEDGLERRALLAGFDEEDADGGELGDEACAQTAVPDNRISA